MYQRQVNSLYASQFISNKDSDIAKNLLNAYQQSSEFKRDTNSEAKLYLILQKLKFKSNYIENIENNLVDGFEKIDFSIMPLILEKLSTQNKEKIKRNVVALYNTLDDKALSNLAVLLKDSELLHKLYIDKKLKLDTLDSISSAMKVSRNPMVLLELSIVSGNIFKETMDLNKILEILIVLDMKDYQLAENFVPVIETTLMAKLKFLNLNTIYTLFKILNLSSIKLLFSEAFKEFIVEKIYAAVEKMPALSSSLYFHTFGIVGFYDEKIFSYLIPAFLNDIKLISDFNNIINGFYGISCVCHFDDRLLKQFKECIKKYRGFMTLKNLALITKIFIDQNFYNEECTNIVLSLIKKNEKENPTYSQFLYHNLELMKIDSPDKISSITEVQKQLKRSNERTYHVSKTQGYVSGVLSSLNLAFNSNVFLNEVYEIDFLLTEDKIIIEAIGMVHHFISFSNKLKPREIARLRHLTLLGYKVVLTVSRESTENFLKKTIFVLKNFDTKKAVCLHNDRVEVINIDLSKKT